MPNGVGYSDQNLYKLNAQDTELNFTFINQQLKDFIELPSNLA
jgi:hypothetical protein